MAYNADNHRMMLPGEARGVGMVTIRNTGLCQDAESRLRRMMRNPQKQAVAATPRRTKVSDRVMRHSGLAHAIPTKSVDKRDHLAQLSDDQIQRLVRCA